MTRHWATTAHGVYLPQLRVLYTSLQRHCAPFRLHVLAEGREVFEWCREQADVEPTLVDALLWRHPRWAADRLPGPPRNGNELACAWRWRFVADLVARTGEPIVLVDADVMFWSSPEPIFDEIVAAGVALVPHAFAPAAAGLPGVTVETHLRYGRMNGGFSRWADPAAAERMAELTRLHSIAADHVLPDGRVIWGDQGWLEVIQEEFGAHVIEHVGAAPGPWSVHTQSLRQSHDGRLFFGGRPLVSFHYSSLRWNPDGSLRQLFDPPYQVTVEQQRLLYDPYLAALGG